MLNVKTDQYGIQYYEAIPPNYKRAQHYTEFLEMKPVMPAKKKDCDAVSLRFLSNTQVEVKDMPEQVLELMYVTKKYWDGLNFADPDAENRAKKRLQYWEKLFIRYGQEDMEKKAFEAKSMIITYKGFFEPKEGTEYLIKSEHSGHVFLNILTKHSDMTILAENIQRGRVYVKDENYVEKTDGTPYWL